MPLYRIFAEINMFRFFSKIASQTMKQKLYKLQEVNIMRRDDNGNVFKFKGNMDKAWANSVVHQLEDDLVINTSKQTYWTEEILDDVSNISPKK